mmetsp:Transcript_31566/g.88635  ORF Transcript_31566/g.88635 Transcript_31566/m.88635 type:complete len:96 (-) Transcript_31566:843-1130(-)
MSAQTENSEHANSYRKAEPLAVEMPPELTEHRPESIARDVLALSYSAMAAVICSSKLRKMCGTKVNRSSNNSSTAKTRKLLEDPLAEGSATPTAE